MIWLFIALTVVTYSFVMVYVLNNIQKPAKRTAQAFANTTSHNKRNNFIPASQTR
ncbi:hypothetical protein [Peribacillus saganii]|uniref:hypothetical protein n=1 Tax=Peribacillus saganii TaxID=2303992 RepID=UPI0013142409|nr:hypothetical protein [Peribacillus saganii]